MRKYIVFTGIFLLFSYLYLDFCNKFGFKISVSYLEYCFFTYTPYLLLFFLLSVCCFGLSIFFKRIKLKMFFLHFFIITIVFWLNGAVFFAITNIRIIKQYDKFMKLLVHSTKWSSDFSEEKFKQIKVGFTRNQIIKILGVPLREFEIDGELILTYSDIGQYTSIVEKGYHQRWIEVDINGKVSKVFNRYLTAESNPLS